MAKLQTVPDAIKKLSDAVEHHVIRKALYHKLNLKSYWELDMK